MVHISETGERRYVSGLTHPLRIGILSLLQSRVAGAPELADRLDAPPGHVRYHLSVLHRMGLVEVFGALSSPPGERRYRARGRVLPGEVGRAGRCPA
jgi:DNA-binding transcriptional ArsR family regulator